MTGTKTFRKGSVLADGVGTRSHADTTAKSTKVLPGNDKPMICCPLNTLLLAGIREILLISTPQAPLPFEQFLGDSSNWG